jgi:hypothetical protein
MVTPFAAAPQLPGLRKLGKSTQSTSAAPGLTLPALLTLSLSHVHSVDVDVGARRHRLLGSGPLDLEGVGPIS